MAWNRLSAILVGAAACALHHQGPVPPVPFPKIAGSEGGERLLRGTGLGGFEAFGLQLRLRGGAIDEQTWENLNRPNVRRARKETDGLLRFNK